MKNFFKIYSSIFFIDEWIIGFIIFLITLMKPNICFSGVISVIIVMLFEKYISKNKISDKPFFYYNTLLVGFSIGALFKLSFLTFILLIGSSMLTFIFTVSMNNFFKNFLKVPILSLPFSIISALCYLFALSNTTLFSNYLIPYTTIFEFNFNFPPMITGYLKALSSIIFISNISAGIILFCILLYFSRIITFLSIMGYYIGALILGEFQGIPVTAFQNLNNFNFMLIAMAIGGFFLIPGISSYIIAFIGVISSAIILGATEVFWSTYNIPVFTLPFNLIVILFLYYTESDLLNLKTYTFLKNPEENLDFYLNYKKRFNDNIFLIGLPFNGEWKITQGFDGNITHKGIWKYGVDFVVIDEQEKQFSGAGYNLENYYSFNKPIISPVNGRIIKIENNIKDNKINDVQRENNWGNYVLIYDKRGFYVKICHFKNQSIIVKQGDFVVKSQVLGYCGNSGYSPFPHIHIQLQHTPEINAGTIKFMFTNIIFDKNKYKFSWSPVENKNVRAMIPSIQKNQKFSILNNKKFNYEINHTEKIKKIEITLKLDIYGYTYFTDGHNKLYFTFINDTFRFYKYTGKTGTLLSYMYMSLPGIPLTDDKIIFEDYIPLKIMFGHFKASLILFFQSFYHKSIIIKSNIRNKNSNEYHSNITYKFFNKIIKQIESTVTLDSHKFIEKITIPNLKISIRKI